VLQKFGEQLDARLDEILTAADAHDADACRKSAHQLKGTAATVAATSLSKVAAELEHLSADGNLNDVAALLDSLRHEVDRCVKEIPHVTDRLSLNKGDVVAVGVDAKCKS